MEHSVIFRRGKTTETEHFIYAMIVTSCDGFSYRVITHWGDDNDTVFGFEFDNAWYQDYQDMRDMTKPISISECAPFLEALKSWYEGDTLKVVQRRTKEHARIAMERHSAFLERINEKS